MDGTGAVFGVLSSSFAETQPPQKLPIYILAMQYTPEWDGETTANAKNELPIIPEVWTTLCKFLLMCDLENDPLNWGNGLFQVECIQTRIEKDDGPRWQNCAPFNLSLRIWMVAIVILFKFSAIRFSNQHHGGGPWADGGFENPLLQNRQDLLPQLVSSSRGLIWEIRGLVLH